MARSAGANPIGTLGVQIAGDTTELTKAVKLAARDVNSFKAKTNIALGKVDRKFALVGKSATKMHKSLKAMIGVGGAAVAVAGFAALTKRAVEFGDRMAKAAKAADISAQRLQELRFAADQSGVAVKDLDDGVRRFARRLGEAQTGGGFLKDFNALIGDPKKFTNTEEALNATLAAISQLPTQAQRAAVASKVFGDDAGPRLALMLNSGIEGVDRLSRKAHELGLVLSDEAAGKAEQAADAFSQLQQVFTVATAEVLLNNADQLANFVGTVVRSIPKIVEATEKFGQFLGLFEKDYSSQIADIDKKIADLEGRGIGTPFGPLSPEAQEAVANNEDVKTQVMALKGRRAILEAAMGSSSILTGGRANPTPPAKPEGLGYNTQSGEAEKMKAMVEAIRSDIATPLDTFGKKIAMVKEAFAQGRISAEEAAAAVAVYKQELADTNPVMEESVSAAQDYINYLRDTRTALEDVAIGGMQGMEDAFIDFISGAKSAGDAFNDFANQVISGLIRIAVQRAIIEPLASAILPGIGLPGFAYGGAFTVGGTGGTDSQLVAFRATPGEHVTVDPNPGGGGGGPIVINQDIHFDVSLEGVRQQIAQAAGPIAEAAKQALYEDQARGGAKRHMMRR